MSSEVLGREKLSKKLIEENCKLIIVVLKDFTVIKYEAASEVRDFGVFGYAFGKKGKDIVEIFWLKSGEVYNVGWSFDKKAPNLYLHHEIASGKKLSEVI
ncbi:MAG: hypothetical protein ACP5PT_02360 [Brevinematia bacterium]